MRLFLVFLLAVVLLTSIAAPVLSETYAILIGISDYLDTGINDLRYPAMEASRFGDLLIQSGTVNQRGVFLLTDSTATKQAIESAFYRVADLEGRTDTVIVYFGGHGGYTDDEGGDEAEGDPFDETLIPYDAEPGKPETFIIDDIFGYWISLFDSQSVAIFIDACHSGGQAKGGGPALFSMSSSGSVVKDIFNDPRASSGRALMTACRSEDSAFELYHEDVQGSVFSVCLLEGLEEHHADANQDGEVTFEELADQVRIGLEEVCKRHQVCQTPIIMNPSGKRMVILGKSLPVPPSGSAITPNPAGSSDSSVTDEPDNVLPSQPSELRISSISAQSIIDTSYDSPHRTVTLRTKGEGSPSWGKAHADYALLSGGGYDRERITLSEIGRDLQLPYGSRMYSIEFPPPPEIPSGATQLPMTIELVDHLGRRYSPVGFSLPVGSAATRKPVDEITGDVFLLLVLIGLVYAIVYGLS